LPYRDEGWHTPRGSHDSKGYRNYYNKDDEILHIALRRWANAFVIARNTVVVPPISKDLACGDAGEGAMARIETIVDFTRESLRWSFPLKKCNGIPVTPHPGAFSHKRKHSHHTGVDLYCEEGERVYAVEDGVIVGIEWFTGAKDESPWWNDTQAILVEGATGVVCYGEIQVSKRCVVGNTVSRGGWLGRVAPVLKEGKERPDIPGHSRCMLHMELYTHGSTKCSVSWGLDKEKAKNMRDPTTWLIRARNAPENFLTYGAMDA
jgi:hypothetical protein